MRVSINPVQITETQSVFMFDHEGRQYYMIGDQEVIGTEQQEVDMRDINWFQSMNLCEITDDVAAVDQIIVQRELDREDF